jgi:hypothetical protein
VNAGMIFASYLVFDELHLLDPQRSFATVLRLLQEIKGISPFLLMSMMHSSLKRDIQATHLILNFHKTTYYLTNFDRKCLSQGMNLVRCR